MNVNFYYNQKRYNSTAAAPQVAFYGDCKFKNPTSLINPVLILHFSGRPAFNYFNIADRYYWVTDIIALNNDLWEIHGAVDALGTFRLHIQNTSAFVLYDSSANTQIPDSRLAIKTDCDAHTASASMPWSFDSGTGTYLICTTGTTDEVDYYNGNINTNAYAGTGVYIIPKGQIEKLGYDGTDILSAWVSSYSTALTNMIAAKNQAESFDFVTQPFESIGAFAKFIGVVLFQSWIFMQDAGRILMQQLLGGGTALSNVRSSYWLPFVIPDAASVANSKPLALGSYKDYITGLRRVNDPIITSAWVTVNIPWQFSDWRNVSCTEVMLYVPLVGCINIPSEVVKGNSSLQVRIALNLYSGSMACEVRCDSANIGTYGANVAMPVLIGDSNVNVGAIVNTITAAASTNPIGLITGTSQSITPMATSVGGIGGGAGVGLNNDIVCICRTHDTSQTPSALLATIGTPTNELKQLNGSGYCQTMNAQMNCGDQTGEPTPTQTEIQMVNTALNSGVYLE